MTNKKHNINYLDQKLGNHDIVDYLKFLFAICVVGIHSNILEGSILYPCLFRIAVPYFFVASGFFLGKKIWINISNPEYKWGGVFKRLIYKLLFFEPISIVLITIQLIRQGFNYNDITWQVIQHILFYPYGALWYIQALIVAFFICIVFLKYFKIKWLIFFSIIFYGFALLCNNYYFFNDTLQSKPYVDFYLKLFISPRNGLLVGLLFVVIGIYISKNELLCIKHKSLNYLFLVISFILVILEYFFLKDKGYADDGGLFLSYYILVPTIFIISISFKANLKNAKFYRNLSTSIYLIHRPILMILVSFFFNFFSFTINSILAFSFTLVLSIFISLLAYKNSTLYKLLT